jgi:hypothetical protein
MTGDSTAAVQPGTAIVRKLLTSAIVTVSNQPLAGMIELRIEGGYVEFEIDVDTALALRNDLERFLTQ